MKISVRNRVEGVSKGYEVFDFETMGDHMESLLNDKKIKNTRDDIKDWLLANVYDYYAGLELAASDAYSVDLVFNVEGVGEIELFAEGE